MLVCFFTELHCDFQSSFKYATLLSSSSLSKFLLKTNSISSGEGIARPFFFLSFLWKNNIMDHT